MCPRKGPCMIRTLSKIWALASLGCLISLSLVLAAPADQHLAQAPEASLTVITGKVIDVHLDGTRNAPDTGWASVSRPTVPDAGGAPAVGQTGDMWPHPRETPV